MTALKYSDRKFSSDIWKTLKHHVSKRNPNVANETHYVCAYCRVRLNRNEMPSRCVLNSLEVDPVPPELDPLSKQMIKRAKAFQAVYRPGT